MDINTIVEEWNTDSIIDRSDISAESLRTPMLHSKYLQKLMSCKQQQIKYATLYLECRSIRSKWYLGEMTSEECFERGWPQYQGLKPLKSDLHSKLDSDPEVLKIKRKVDYLEAMREQLESILNQIRGRDWTIKNFIQWEMFKAGS